MSRFFDSTRPRRATALLVCIAFLATISLLGVAFARLMDTERAASGIHRHQVEADLAAEAGLEMAVGRLQSRAGRQVADWIRDPWIYNPVEARGLAGPLGPVAGVGTPLGRCDRPSFAHDADGDGTPDPVAGRIVSGVLDPGADFVKTFRLKVLDTASGIDLNGPEDVVRLQLGNLGKILTARHGRAILSSEVVDRILDERAGQGRFGDRRDLLRAGLVSRADFDLVRDVVTARARQDRRTVRALPPFYRDGQRVRSRVLPEFGLSPRAPVNLNTAGLDVLAANVGGTTGIWFETDPTSIEYEIARRMTIPLETAFRVAEEIVAARAIEPFEGFDRFRAFADGLYRRQILNRIQAAMLVRMADPTTVVVGDVSKLDRVAHGTEFCFDSGGRFEIECQSQVIAGGEVVAESWLRTVVDVFRDLTDSSLADFEQGEASPAETMTVRVGNRLVDLAPESDRSVIVQAEVRPDAETQDPASVNATLNVTRYKPVAEEVTFRNSFRGDLAPEHSAGPSRPILRSGVRPSDVVTDDGLYARNGSGVSFPLDGNFDPEKGTLSFNYEPKWQYNYGYGQYSLIEVAIPDPESKNFYAMRVATHNYCGVVYFLVTIYAPPAVVWEAEFYVPDGYEFIRNQEERQLTLTWDLTPGTVPDTSSIARLYVDGEPQVPEYAEGIVNEDYFVPPAQGPVGRLVDPGRVPVEPLLHVGFPPTYDEISPPLVAGPTFDELGFLGVLGDGYARYRRAAIAEAWDTYTPSWWRRTANRATPLNWFLQWYEDSFVERDSDEDFRSRMIEAYGAPSGSQRYWSEWSGWPWGFAMPEADRYPPLVSYAVPRWHAQRDSVEVPNTSANGLISDLNIFPESRDEAWVREWYGSGGFYGGEARFTRTFPASQVGRTARLAAVTYLERRFDPLEPGAVRIAVSDDAGPLGEVSGPVGAALGDGVPIEGSLTYDVYLSLVALEGNEFLGPVVDAIRFRLLHAPVALLREGLRDEIYQVPAPVEPVESLPPVDLFDEPDRALPPEVYAELEDGHYNEFHDVPILPADTLPQAEGDPDSRPAGAPFRPTASVRTPPSGPGSGVRVAPAGRGGGSTPRRFSASPAGPTASGGGPGPSASGSTGGGGGGVWRPSPRSGGGGWLAGTTGRDRRQPVEDGTALQRSPDDGGGGGGEERHHVLGGRQTEGFLVVEVAAAAEQPRERVEQAEFVAVDLDGKRHVLDLDRDSSRPTWVARLEPGRYELRISGPGLVDHSQVVIVLDRRVTNIDAELDFE